ncbi:hypothetical protein FOMPIDRAFT_1029110 [Fomitopsis schrenkii]|uniref:Uncharacterized protein n=1 Tax=Fomitopsis schrenkii TaxID=2126942 RepID=S8EE38_FOMSC|nr:hypothetical protein FOMPIDRAFT_1029110 [Fomitopsis schrenkii]
MHLRASRHVALRPHWEASLNFARPGAAEHDSCGIPVKPTWSVNQLLSSYPQPSLPPFTLQRLHALSALITPAEGTPEHVELTREMEGLIKLVEAVKLVDTGSLRSGSDFPIPDGRIWAEGKGVEIEQRVGHEGSTAEPSGRDLLRHSSRVRDGLYVVDADKRK